MNWLKRLRGIVTSNPGRTILATLTLGYAVYTVIAFGSGKFIADRTFTYGPEAVFHIAFWTLVPPVYFFMEYYVFVEPKKQAETKIAQEFASKIWAAVLAAVLFLARK